MRNIYVVKRFQKGVTLIELMISMVVGMVVIGAISGIYLMNVSATANTINSTRLIQTMNSIMTLMVNDIRRAGFVDPSGGATPSTNPFNAFDSTALEIHAAFDGAEVDLGGVSTTGSCILFAYDVNTDGNMTDGGDNEEITGFRLRNDAVEIKTGVFDSGDHDNCNRVGDTWDALNNPALIKITSLVFDHIGSDCLNTREPDGIDNGGTADIDDAAEADCYVTAPVAGSGDITVETREIEITMIGELAEDPSVSYQLEQTVRVRNDLVRQR